MQHHAQSDRLSAQLKRARADQAAGDILKHHLQSDASEQMEDEIVGDVQRAGDQTDPQNSRKIASSLRTRCGFSGPVRAREKKLLRLDALR